MARNISLSSQTSAISDDSSYDGDQTKKGKRAKGVTPMLVMAVLGCICGTNLVLGYNISVINNPSTVIKTFFNETKYNRTGSYFTTRALNWFWSSCVAALPVLAPLGCFIGSEAAKRFGRRKTLLLNNVFLVISALMQATTKAAKSYELFFFGRLFLGLQAGIGSTVGPMYIAEVTPLKYRAAFGATNSLMFAIGLVLSSILGFVEVLGNESHWPHLFLVTLVFAALNILTLGMSPESPYYLLIDEKDKDAAYQSLRTLRGKKYPVEEDLEHIAQEHEKTTRMPKVAYKDFCRKKELRRPLLLAFGLMGCLQFCGIYALITYSEPIFAAVLSSAENPNDRLATHLVAVVSATRLVTTAISIPFLDKIGRRRCELFSILGLIASNTALAFLLSNLSTGGQVCYGIPVGQKGNFAALVFIFLQSIWFSFGVNTIPWIVTPELFRTNARPKAVFLVATVYWMSNFLVSLSFDLIQQKICGWVFFIFSVLLVLFFVFFYFKLPVLEGKTVDEIAMIFEDAPQESQQVSESEDSPRKETTRERKRLLK